MTATIETRALRKVYKVPPPSRRARRAPGGFAPPMAMSQTPLPNAGGDVVALDALDLTIRAGEFFGLLGPNGAGKTTTLGILTTRVIPTSGEARVGDADVARDPVGVRRRIGVVPQRPNPDRSLTVVENLLFHAAYYGVPRAAAAQRADALLAQ